MLGGCVFRYTSVVLVFLAAPVFAEKSELLKLQQKRENLAALLLKVQKGSDPCFSDSCQSKKFQLVNQIDRMTDSLPSSNLFLPARIEAIQSGFDLIRNKFIPPNPGFPRTSSQWATYWKMRSSHEKQFRSSWMSFQSEVYSLNEGFKFFLDAAQSDEENQNLIQEAWDRGMGDAVEKIMRAKALSEQALTLDAIGKSQDAKTLRLKAVEITRERLAIEEKFNGKFRPLLEMLFSKYSFDQTVAFSDLIKKWTDRYGTPQLFELDFIERMTEHSKAIHELTLKVQEFTDLEYGYIGLSNFYSVSNPQVRNENEIIAQEFLDRVESTARTLTELGASYLLFKAGPLFFDTKVLQNIALPTAYQLLREEKGWNVSDLFIQPHQHTARLKEESKSLEGQMEARKGQLLLTLKAIKQKISELDFKISLLQQMEGTHETDSKS